MNAVAAPISKRLQRYAAEKNKRFILDVLRPRVEAVRTEKASELGLLGEDTPVKLLEVAAGTGEHASLFLEHIPNLLYLPTEMDKSMHESIADYLKDFPGRAAPPIALDVNDFEAALEQVDPLFGHVRHSVDVMVCINMIHISPFASTHGLFRLASHVLSRDGFLLTYGPYRVKNFMVESNVKFDESLRERNSEWGVRDLEAVEAVAQQHGMRIQETIEMPANNLCVVFVKIE